MEQETILNEEEILLPQDVAVLRAEMYSKISDALFLGVFTEEEAKQWKEGFEACIESSHMENLIDIIDNFVGSGLAIINKIEDLLSNNLINESEKRYWRNYSEDVNFDEKQQVIQILKASLEDIIKLKNQLIGILNSKAVDSHKKEQLLNDFKSQNINSKKQTIQAAKELKVKNSNNITPLQKPIFEAKTPNSNSLKETTEISEAQANQKQLQSKHQKIIDNCLISHQFKTARNVLEGGKKYFNLKQYRILSRLIDIEEIKVTKNSLSLPFV